MNKLQISEEQRKEIYDHVESITPHSDIYFSDHVRPVAKNCRFYAEHLLFRGRSNIDPVICELGGLLHDIGYSKEFEQEEKDHIVKGTKMAPTILERIGITGEYKDRIVDTIWTHDGNQHRSRYIHIIDRDIIIPPDNEIVNDVDAMQLFDWNIASLLEFSLRLRPNRPIDEVAKGVLEHVNSTFNYITMDYFREIAKTKYEARVNELEFLINQNN